MTAPPPQAPPSAKADRLLLAGIAGLAAFAFLWQLGSSSAFVDEALTLDLTRGDLDRLITGVEQAETSPPTYTLVVDGWLNLLGTRADWVARLPSALAALGLVAAVFRIGEIVAGRRAGLVAALLAAVSPLVLHYAQQARPYSLLMLFAAVAVLAALEAERRRSRGWLIVAAVAVAGMLSIHYIALIVVVPLAVWVAARTGFDRITRAGFCATAAVVFGAWTPLMLDQYDRHPEGGVGPYADLSLLHLARVVGAPFDPRYAEDEASVLVYLGAAAIIAAGGVVLAGLRRARKPEVELVLALAFAAPAALLALSLLGKDALISRYATVSVPFMLVVLAAAAVTAYRPLGLGMLAAVLVAAVVGTVQSHRPAKFYPDTRDVVARIADDERPGDVVVQWTNFAVYYTLNYYAVEELGSGPPVVEAGNPAVRQAIGQRRRLWLVSLDETASSARQVVPGDYRVRRSERFPGVLPLNLLLVEPAGRG